MWNSGKKIRALRDKKNNSNSCVFRKKKFWTKQKTITSPLPFKLNGRSLIYWQISFHAVYIRLTIMRFLTLRWAIALTLLQRKTTDSRDLPLLDNTSHDHPGQSCRLWINRPWRIWTLLGSMNWGEMSLLVLLILMQ